MFLRFVRPNLIHGMAARRGFFSAAYELRNTPTTAESAAERVTTLLNWFHLNLPEPTTFNRATLRNFYRGQGFTKGLSWFKPEASAMLAKSRNLIALLTENGYPIETLRSTRVGYVLYEDPHQIVAEPFSDTPT